MHRVGGCVASGPVGLRPPEFRTTAQRPAPAAGGCAEIGARLAPAPGGPRHAVEQQPTPARRDLAAQHPPDTYAGVTSDAIWRVVEAARTGQPLVTTDAGWILPMAAESSHPNGHAEVKR
jgi:hypothetical protein